MFLQLNYFAANALVELCCLSIQWCAENSGKSYSEWVKLHYSTDCSQLVKPGVKGNDRGQQSQLGLSHTTIDLYIDFLLFRAEVHIMKGDYRFC